MARVVAKDSSKVPLNVWPFEALNVGGAGIPKFSSTVTTSVVDVVVQTVI